MNLTGKDLQFLHDVAVESATKAGQYIQSRFDTTHDKQIKEGPDSIASQVVTEVDFKAQDIILSNLKSSIDQFDIGVLTEEATDDSSRFAKEHFWCIDPMDGTLAFIEGRTGYSVSVALVSKAGDPIIGVVYIPDLEECYSAIKGQQVWLNGGPMVPASDPSGILKVYMDHSFAKDSNREVIMEYMVRWARNNGINKVESKAEWGAVRNAIGVLTSDIGCYFKFPKKQQGGGSIWDFAATRLMAEVLCLHVSDASGNTLHLNSSRTTYMNEVGVLYATDEKLRDHILKLQNEMSA